MFKVQLVILTAACGLAGCEFEIPGNVSKTGKTEQFVFTGDVYTAEEFAKSLTETRRPSQPPRREDFDLSTRYYQVKVQGSPVKCDAPSTQGCKTAIDSYQKKMQRESGMGY